MYFSASDHGIRPPVAPARSPRERSFASSLLPGGSASTEIATKSERLPLFSAISADPAAPSRIRMTASAARAGRRSRLPGRRFGPPPADRAAPRAPWDGVRVEDERLTRLP